MADLGIAIKFNNLYMKSFPQLKPPKTHMISNLYSLSPGFFMHNKEERCNTPTAITPPVC